MNILQLQDLKDIDMLLLTCETIKTLNVIRRESASQNFENTNSSDLSILIENYDKNISPNRI